MIFDDEVWEDYVLKDKDLKKIPVKNKEGKIFNTFREYEQNQEKILLVNPSMGSSASSTELEILIASGIKKVVAFGTCGAMDKNIGKNTLIIPISALREEGVSYHYLPPADEVNQTQKSIEEIERVFISNSLSYSTGKVWTTDAVYRETAKKLKLMKDKGAIAVDMEMASLLAVAEFRKIDFAGFLITDDNIDGKSDKELKKDNSQLLQLALDIAVSL
jgi:purine-nucleoside phosphorylase